MEGTLDERAFEIEELVGLPLERRASMGAMVAVAVNPAPYADHEDLGGIFSIAKAKAAASRIRELIQSAKHPRATHPQPPS